MKDITRECMLIEHVCGLFTEKIYAASILCCQNQIKVQKYNLLTTQSKTLNDDLKYMRAPTPYILMNISNINRPRNTYSI